jgi:hypothetical protein
MIRSWPLFLMSILLCSLVFCKTKQESVKTESVETLKKPISDKKKTFPGEIEARVVDMTGLDGCTFLLKLNNGENLEPINLPADFKIKELKVMITYELFQGASICMAGKMIKITHIRKKDH